MTPNKEKLKKFISSVIDETLDEMTATGNVAGYSTPFAFTKNKKGNEKAATSAGYSIVEKEETVEPSDNIISEGVVGDPFVGRKISSYLAETNRMLSVVETLLLRRSNPKYAKMMKENSFAKRTPKDISDIQEKCGRITGLFKKNQTPTDQLVKESATPTLQSRTFDISTGFTNFQSDLSNLTSGYETLFNQELVGKEATIRASKGYGQIKKDYKITPTSVTISIMKDKYELVLKDKQQRDYYLDTTFKISISGADKSSEQPIESNPTQQEAPSTEQTPQK